MKMPKPIPFEKARNDWFAVRTSRKPRRMPKWLATALLIAALIAATTFAAISFLVAVQKIVHAEVQQACTRTIYKDQDRVLQ